MKKFQVVYVPAGVPTFHLESAQKEFEKSVAMLHGVDPEVVCPEEMLLSMDLLGAFLEPLNPDLVIFQNITFANAAYMSEVLHRVECPVLLWTLREPVIDGGRLRLNSLTGAYSAANALKAFGRDFEYVFGSPEEDRVRSTVSACIAAARVRHEMRGLNVAAVGHTPQGFGFGRALDSEMLVSFGATLQAIEARELIDRAKGYTDEECVEFLSRSRWDWTPLRRKIWRITPGCTRPIRTMCRKIASVRWHPAAGRISSRPLERPSARCCPCSTTTVWRLPARRTSTARCLCGLA